MANRNNTSVQLAAINAATVVGVTQGILLSNVVSGGQVRQANVNARTRVGKNRTTNTVNVNLVF